RCQIDPRTFRNWKAGKFTPDEDIAKEFMDTLALAYIDQKEQVGTAMFECDDKSKGDWRRYSFVLERRYKDDFGQTSTLEVNNKKETIIQISASSDEQKQLIENVINTDFVEVPRKRIELDAKDNKEDEYEF